MNQAKHIRVFGHPHSGTSIIKSILGHIDEVYEHPYEIENITPDIINESVNAKYIVTKWPFVSENFFDYSTPETSKDTIQIFVIRNPFYALSSINQRFNYNIHAGHTAQDWYKDAALFLKTSQSPQSNIYCIKYEDLFPDNYAKVKKLFNQIGLNFTDEIFNNIKRNNVIVPGAGKWDNVSPLPGPLRHVEISGYGPGFRPNVKDHGHYRTWQINQEFKNMNSDDKLDLSNEQIEYLCTDKVQDIFKQLGYEIPSVLRVRQSK